jgi:hypothetical protein
MSRTTSLWTSYLQAAIFAGIGIRCYMAWQRDRDRRSGHLALAAGLFGLSSLLGAITTTFIDQTKLEQVPRWESITSGIILYLSIYFFMLFLSDFIAFPKVVHVMLVGVTAAAIVFSFIERPDLRLNLKTFQIEKIPGITNPIDYRTYINIVLAYLIIAFGVLALSFFVYGFRSRGLARFRMVSIASGFFLFCVVLGLLPRILASGTPAQTVKNLLNVLTYVALAVGPLLFVGFSPPRFIRDWFPESSAAPARS